MLKQFTIWAGVLSALFTLDAYSMEYVTYEEVYTYSSNANLYLSPVNDSAHEIRATSKNDLLVQYCQTFRGGILQYLADHLGGGVVLGSIDRISATDELICETLFEYGGYTGQNISYINMSKPYNYYNNEGIWTLRSTAQNAPTIIEVCGLNEPIGVDFPAGTLGSLNQPDVPYTNCIENCEALFDGLKANYELGVDPAIADSYGCTFNQDGFISGCPSDTPVRLWVQYFTTGEVCSTPSGIAPLPDTDPATADYTPITDKITETNTTLQSIETELKDTSQIPTYQNDVENSATKNTLKTKINDIANGTYKPFGTGFNAIFPTIAGAGTCPDLDFTFHGVHMDITNENSCQYFALLTTAMDFMFFFLTFLFVYSEWRDAMERIL